LPKKTEGPTSSIPSKKTTLICAEGERRDGSDEPDAAEKGEERNDAVLYVNILKRKKTRCFSARKWKGGKVAKEEGGGFQHLYPADTGREGEEWV